MSEENKKIDSLKEKLFYTQKHASEIISDDETKKADEFCDGYMDFLRTAKTEREATEYFVEKAEKLKNEIKSRYPFKDVRIFKASGLSTVYADDGGIVIAF